MATRETCFYRAGRHYNTWNNKGCLIAYDITRSLIRKCITNGGYCNYNSARRYTSFHQHHVWNCSWYKQHHHYRRPNNVMITRHMYFHMGRAAHSHTDPQQHVTGRCHCQSPVSNMSDPELLRDCDQGIFPSLQGSVHMYIGGGRFHVWSLPSHLLLRILGTD